MTTQRSLLEHAAGKLIAAVQREWHAELGEPGAAASEHVMHACHDLLNAAKDVSGHVIRRSTRQFSPPSKYVNDRRSVTRMSMHRPRPAVPIAPGQRLKAGALHHES